MNFIVSYMRNKMFHQRIKLSSENVVDTSTMEVFEVFYDSTKESTR